ncbi:MAG: hypothetical protein ACTHNN_19845, partial [Xanthobacteraceae bacterium]
TRCGCRPVAQKRANQTYRIASSLTLLAMAERYRTIRNQTTESIQQDQPAQRIDVAPAVFLPASVGLRPHESLVLQTFGIMRAR